MTEERPRRNGEPLATLSPTEGSPEVRRYLLQNLVHELSTPLTPLLGYLKLFRNRSLGDLTELQERCLARMDSSAKRLNRLLEDVSMLLAMESGAYQVEPKPVDFLNVLCLATDAHHEAAQESEIEIIESLPDPETTFIVLGDGARLQNALEHLLANSLKFNSPGGKVFLQVHSLTLQGAPWLRFELFDSGIGVRPEELTRIFEPFYQSDHSETRRFGGAGLGLTLARLIIERHGGTLALESPPEVQPDGHFFRGVRVILTLPLADEHLEDED